MLSARLRALSLFLVAGASLMAQTTGGLQGRVMDAQRAPVGGAKVSLSGSNLQGTRSVMTESDGTFRFGLIPPGAYLITVTKDGLNTSKAEVRVGLDTTATADVAMSAIATASVDVVDTATVVDVSSAASGSNFTNETFQKLPIVRDYASIAQLAPGVTEEPGLPNNQSGFKVYGSSAAENNYVVDGINTTGTEFGTQGKKIPVEFIQEFQIKTGGFEAEYGRALGGIVNVVTKSGGNEFSGDVFGYYTSDKLQSSNNHAGEQTFIPQPTAFNEKDFGFDVGGYVIKDKLWFFVAYDRALQSRDFKITTGSTAGQTAPVDTTRDLFAGKLTWKITENQNLIASFLGDPEKDLGAVKDAIGPQSTWDGEQKFGGTDLSLRYEITGDWWFGELQTTRHKETNSTLPQAFNANQIQYVDNRTTPVIGGGAESGGFGRFDDKTFTRDNITGSLTFLFSGAGSHELKVGFDIQTDKADISRGYTGGQQVTIYDSNTANPTQYVYNHYFWTSPDYVLDTTTPSNSYLPSITFRSHPKHESKAYYAQDKWSVTPRLVLNLGVRYDTTDIKDQFGKTVISLKDQWSPRLGVIYDFRGNGQDKVYMSLARYYEQVPLDLVIRSFSSEINPSIYNYDPVSTTPAAGNAAGTSSVVGSYIEPVDPDLKGQYSDEFILGGETTRGLYVFGAKYIRRYVGRVVEDALDVNSSVGDYFIMNPGFSQTGKEYPRAVRDYKGVELTAQRKFADHYTWQASYLWSKLDGNYEGAFQGIGGPLGNGQLDPNINSAFDEPAFLVNNHGPLSGDRRHQFKVNGYYEWSSGFSLGAAFRYMSGTPETRLGNADQVTPFPYSGRWELFLTPRGAEGTTPSIAQMDVNVAYDLHMGGKNRLRFMADIFNLFDSQKATQVDQRYNFSGADVGQTNPNYLHGLSFQSPRSIRLGIRYSF